MITQINKLPDVEAFTKALINEGTSFHPDDDFTEYVNKTSGKPPYTPREAKFRNKLMERCFAVCTDEKVDVYDFMLEISLKESGMDKYIPLPSESN